MSCTSKPLAPEARRPLHAKVTSLREERITLLEQTRSLREQNAALRKEAADAIKRKRREKGKSKSTPQGSASLD